MSTMGRRLARDDSYLRSEAYRIGLADEVVPDAHVIRGRSSRNAPPKFQGR